MPINMLSIWRMLKKKKNRTKCMPWDRESIKRLNITCEKRGGGGQVTINDNTNINVTKWYIRNYIVYAISRTNWIWYVSSTCEWTHVNDFGDFSSIICITARCRRDFLWFCGLYWWYETYLINWQRKRWKKHDEFSKRALCQIVRRFNNQYFTETITTTYTLCGHNDHKH